MRLAGLHIEGFGLFHGLKIEGLSPGINVFLGPNESGKSTLLGFVRSVFFGFPDGRSHLNPYPPLSGGRHGGNLTLFDGRGELYVVERFAGPKGGYVEVLKPDQTRGDKAFLDKLLGMVNGTLFKNVYAFSLSELQHFNSLSTEEVREALYSAGAGIDPKRLTSVKNDLEKREGDLFKPGGTKPKISQNLSRLFAIMKEKKALSGSIDQYDKIKTVLSDGAEEVKVLEEKVHSLILDLKKSEQWIQIWPDWIHYSLSKKKLEGLADIDHFPLKGLSRFESLKSRLEDLKGGLWERSQDLKRQERELGGLKIDEEILDQAKPILQLQRDQGHFEAVGQELHSLEQETETDAGKLEEDLKRLGPYWSEEKVLGFDLSIITRELVRQQRENLQKARLNAQRKGDALENEVSKEREAESGLRGLQEPPEKNLDILLQKRQSCQALRRLDIRNQLIKTELEQIEARIDDLKEDEGVFRGGFKPPDHEWPLWPAPAMIAIGLLFLLWFGYGDGSPLVLAFGGILLISGGTLWVKKSRKKKREGRADEDLEKWSEGIRDKRAGLEDKQRERVEEFDSIRGQCSGEKANLSLSDPYSMDDLDRVENELRSQRRQLERWLESSDALEQIKKRSEEARSALKQAESEKESVELQWRNWLEVHDLDPVLSPDGALETLTLIASYKEHSAHLDRLRSRRAALGEIRKKYIDLVKGILEGAKGSLGPEDDISVVVHTLIKDFTASEQSKQKRDLLRKEIEVSREIVERLQKQIEGVEKELRVLMSAGGSEREEEFRERALIYEQRMAHRGEMERYRDNIERLSSLLGEEAGVLEQLPEMHLEILEEDKTKLEKDLQDCHEALDRSKKEQATLEEQIRQIVNDESISALRAEEEALKEALSLMAEEWAVIKIAQGLIRTAGARYEKERQPKVIREAGQYFETLTSGKYPALAAPMGENRIEVVTRSQSRKEIGQLSRGTAEQLYLSLRFGFIREFSKRSETLPIIMDETLVNFDPLRAKATVRAISELSREHQILFFTCHPEVVNLFSEVDPGVSILEIHEGHVKKWEE